MSNNIDVTGIVPELQGTDLTGRIGRAGSRLAMRRARLRQPSDDGCSGAYVAARHSVASPRIVQRYRWQGAIRSLTVERCPERWLP